MGEIIDNPNQKTTQINSGLNDTSKQLELQAQYSNTSNLGIPQSEIDTPLENADKMKPINGRVPPNSPYQAGGKKSKYTILYKNIIFNSNKDKKDALKDFLAKHFKTQCQATINVVANSNKRKSKYVIKRTKNNIVVNPTKI